MSSSDLSGETPDAAIDPDLTSGEPTDATLSLRQLAEALGPFEPPVGFDHGEEFACVAPRPIPKILRKGSFSHRRRSVAFIFAALGASFVVVAPWPIIHKLSFYVLPLAYLGRVGYGMILISLLIALRNRFSKERFQYVVSGIPFVGRVLGVGHQLTRTLNSETKQEVVEFQFLVPVEFDDPESGRHEFAAVISEEKWNLPKSSKYGATVAAGDYVTLVGLPGRISETLRLYGFLGLDPQRDFLTYRGKPLTGASPLTAILIATLVFAGLWFFVALLYSITFCIPSEWSWPLGLTFMGTGGVVGAMVGALLGLRNAERSESKSPGAVVLGLLGLLFGVLGGAMAMGLINASFDRSTPTYRPVSIDTHWQTTHKFIFRDYEIEYTEFGKANSEKSHVSFDDLIRLGTSKLGAKEIRQGALGLEWVAGFHPCQWAPLPDNPDPLDAARAVTVDAKKWFLAQIRKTGLQLSEDNLALLGDNEKGPLKLIPVLLLPDGSHVSAPEELVERATQQLKNETN